MFSLQFLFVGPPSSEESAPDGAEQAAALGAHQFCSTLAKRRSCSRGAVLARHVVLCPTDSRVPSQFVCFWESFRCLLDCVSVLRVSLRRVVHISVAAAWRDEEAAFGDLFVCSWPTARCFFPALYGCCPLETTSGQADASCSRVAAPRVVWSDESFFQLCEHSPTIRARGSVGVSHVSQLLCHSRSSWRMQSTGLWHHGRS